MHIMELLGRSRVKVVDEKVQEASEPMIKWCPLFDKVRGIKEVTARSAAENMEFRIKNHGMFSARRRLKKSDNWAEHASASTPPVSSTLWLWRGSCKISNTEPAAPVLRSRAP